MKAATTVIVTGANRGIGQAICQLVLSKPDVLPLNLLATSRKGEDLSLATSDGDRQVQYPRLDISDPDSIEALANFTSQKGKIDVLVNNAGVNLDAQYGPQNAKRTLDVNFRGTLEMCKTFIPLMSPKGRIVTLSSVASTLKPYGEQIQRRFRNPDMTLNDLEDLAKEYEQSVRDKTEAASGFVGPGRAYSFSKACVNAMTRILAKENPHLTINACCPGWVKTDMGLLVGRPPKTPAEGAWIPVRLAFGDIGGVSGRYWANASVRSREEGEVQDW